MVLYSNRPVLNSITGPYLPLLHLSTHIFDEIQKKQENEIINKFQCF